MAFLSPVFLTENFSTMFKIFVINGWVVIAMTLVLISGGIDLSVAAVMAFVGVVAGQLFLVYHWNIWIASLAGIGVGVFVGFVNGFFITRVGLSPFIVIGELAGDGRVSPANTLDFKMRATAHTSGPAALLGKTAVPFVVEGSAANPVFKPDVKAAAAEEVKSVKEDAAGVLNNLLGRKKR